MNLPFIKQPIPAGRRTLAAAALTLLFLAGPVVAKDAKPPEFDSPEFDSPAKVKPGTTGLLKAAGKGMRYFLRVPKKYDARNGARLIVFLHGSSMNGLDYLRSFEVKQWCEDDILCGPNGENGTDPFGQNNFKTIPRPPRQLASPKACRGSHPPRPPPSPAPERKPPCRSHEPCLPRSGSRSG